MDNGTLEPLLGRLGNLPQSRAWLALDSRYWDIQLGWPWVGWAVRRHGRHRTESTLRAKLV